MAYGKCRHLNEVTKRRPRSAKSRAALARASGRCILQELRPFNMAHHLGSLSWSFAFLLILLFATTVEAACSGSSPIWTTTPDQASVTTCVGNAVDGDTVNVLAGSATWSNLVIANKSISLIGAGAGNTDISGGVLFRIITKALGGTPEGV